MNTVSPSEDTLLHVAARHGRVEIKRLICEKLPSLVSKKNSDGDTVLHVAARQGSVEVVRLVCQKFPSLVTDKNLEGDTSLHVAARQGIHYSTKFLDLNRGSNNTFCSDGSLGSTMHKHGEN